MVSSSFEKSSGGTSCYAGNTEFLKNLLLYSLYREGKEKKNLTLLVCFLLPLKREIKTVWHLQPVSSIWRPLAFLPVTALSVSSLYQGWNIRPPYHAPLCPQVTEGAISNVFEHHLFPGALDFQPMLSSRQTLLIT